MSGEYCEECSTEVLGFNCADFADLISEKQTKTGYGARAYCEECGDIFVDHMGKRIAFVEQFINNIEDTENVTEGSSQSIST